jgi:hypothetical protein
LIQPLADPITGMPNGAAIGCGLAHHAMLADRAIDGDFLDEGGRIVGLVGAQGDAARPLAAVEYDKRRFPFWTTPGGLGSRPTSEALA